MPPADSTEGCAAYGPISTARKKREYRDGTSFIYAYSTRQGQERGFSPPRDVRHLSFATLRKARSLSTRLGPARPLGHPPGRSFREPCDPPSIFLFFFLKVIGTSFGLKELPLSESVPYSGKPMPGAGTPTRLPAREKFRELCGPPFSFFFWKATQWVLGPLLVIVLG